MRNCESATATAATTTTTTTSPSASMINRSAEATLNRTAPRNKNRRKRKFLSLRLCLQLSNPQLITDMSFNAATTSRGSTTAITAQSHHQHKLNLFPLHPGNLVEDKDIQDENVACFFSASDSDATSLTGILGSTDTSYSEEDVANTVLPAASRSQSPLKDQQGALVRAALRKKQRDGSDEEKWVCYSEVVEERKEEEVSSCDADHLLRMRGLSLKLDYQGILNEWSDKGPLYIHDPESPQTVPDLLHDEFTTTESPYVGSDKLGSKYEVWMVPEMGLNNIGVDVGVKDEDEVGRRRRREREREREASVLRYKAKRQNRLFSKKIRYQVRKLNAQMRPRIKGRFVKRN